MFKSKACPHCGNAVREEASFCLDCGLRIDGDEDDTPTNIHEVTEKMRAIKLEEPIPLTIVDLIPEPDEAAVAFLKIEAGSDKGQNIPLHETLFIGRIKRRDGFRVTDPYVSREHAVIERSGDGFILKNLSETNGTTVNGRQTENHSLTAGDVVEIGYTVMTFHLSAD